MSKPEPGRLLRLVRSPRESQPDALVELARAAGAGDRQATRTFLVTIAPQLLRVVRKVLGAHHQDVEDVAQESAFAVIEALRGYREECSVLHFACRIAVLTAMNARRRDGAKKRASIREVEVEVETVAASQPSQEAELDQQARIQIVRELLDTLPTEQADVLAMHCVLGYTMREISEASQVPLETVRSRFRLAKQALRRRIADDPQLTRLAENA